jgi:hypothetical protein
MFFFRRALYNCPLFDHARTIKSENMVRMRMRVEMFVFGNLRRRNKKLDALNLSRRRRREEFFFFLSGIK